ncbi:MAG: aspartyl protease family protein [Thermoanaerobaculia bacterium]
MKRVLFALVLAACTTAPLQRDLTRIPVQIAGTRVLVPVSVNGKAPATFILDTGAATTTVEKDYAHANGIVASTTTHAMGASGAVDVGVATDLEFAIGGIRIDPPRSPLIPLGAINLRAGIAAQGVLGYEAFASYVVEIDYENRGVAFHDPATFAGPEGAVRVPVEMAHRTPVATVQLSLPDGRTIPARLLIDTGASSALTLTRSFTEKNDVEVAGGIETSLGLGVGGATRELTGRIARLEFGGFPFDKPVAALSRSTGGVLGGSQIDGILGGEILRRFTLFVDYGRRQLLLMPNRALHDPIDIDMTGALLAARDSAFDAIVVHNVLSDSPAAHAGVRAGDELRAIDGRAVTAAQLDDVRKLFKSEGRRFTLTLVRDGAEMSVPITTRRLV